MKIDGRKTGRTNNIERKIVKTNKNGILKRELVKLKRATFTVERNQKIQIY